MTLSRRFGIVGALVLTALANAATGRAEPWRQLGPEGGTIDLLAFAPGDHHVVYAATAADVSRDAPWAGHGGGRIFRSADGGATWSPASQGLPVLRVLCLAVDPVRPDVVYAGNADGVWKTTNGGKAWIGFPGRLAGLAVTALAIDPNKPSTIYAGTQYYGIVDTPPGRVYRSDDGGRTWVEHSNGLSDSSSVAALAVDPAASNAVAAILTDFGVCNGPSFWKSSDRGRSWHEAGLVGLPDVPGVVCPVSTPFSGFQLDPSSHTLYVAIYGGDFGVLLDSSDFGETWGGFVLYAPAYVAVSSTGRLYGLFELSGLAPFLETSSDGGATWQPAGQLPAAVQLLAVDPSSPGRVLAGAVLGGLLRTDDGGASWSPSNAGLLATTITAVAVAATGPATVYAGTADAGLVVSHDGGARWEPVDLGFRGDGNDFPHQITALALTERELWTAVDGTLLRSRDGGGTWDWVPADTCSWVTAVAPDPTSASVFASTQAFTDRDCTYGCPLLESRDSGASWSCTKQDFWSAGTLVIDPAAPWLVYALAYDGHGSDLWKSVNRGWTFKQLAYDVRDFSSLALSPANRRLLWAGTVTHGLWKSADQGARWSAAGGGLAAGPVVALVADPADAAIAYAEIAGLGVFGTRDYGASWQPLGEGLPGALLDATLAIGVQNGHRVLYAGTAGAGLFALPIP